MGGVGGGEVRQGTRCHSAPSPLPGQRPAPSGACSLPAPSTWERVFLCLWEGPSLPPPSAFLSGEASMERFLAQLCGTSALQPLPVWEGDTTGHCFTQLVLSALPHALLAVLSACHWGNPRWVETGARDLSLCSCRPHSKPTSPWKCNRNSEISGVGGKSRIKCGHDHSAALWLSGASYLTSLSLITSLGDLT